MSVIAVPDLHGSMRLLEKVLERFPDRPLVFLGDLIDRGPHSKQVVRLVRRLVQEGRAKLCLGNHEQMAIRAVLSEGEAARAAHMDWLRCGGNATVQSYGWDAQGWSELNVDLHWIQSHAQRVIVEDGVLYCHAMRPLASKDGAFDAFDARVTWGRPHVDTLESLPDGVRYSVHGHTIFKDPVVDLWNFQAAWIDLGGDLRTENWQGRFCVWDASQEKAILL